MLCRARATPARATSSRCRARWTTASELFMTGGAQTGRLRHAEHVMGTVVSFDVPACVGGAFAGDETRGALGQAVRWLHWVDATFSPYRDDSDVSRFGRGALLLAECAPELAEVLAACAAVSALSGGDFTPPPGGRLDPSRVLN